MSDILLADILCPISLEIMENPVMAPDGHNYEKSCIVSWLKQHGTSPYDRRQMTESQLTPNYLLKEQIERYKQNVTTAEQLKTSVFKNAECKVDKTFHDGLLHVRVTPPSNGPRQGIVLGIGVDNSGSMATLACELNETKGKAFTRLDLTKHTLRVLIGMLSAQDVLYIVKFDDVAYTVLSPTNMTKEGKEKAEVAVKSIIPAGSTNIWGCIKMLNDIAQQYQGCNVVTAILTDGEANIRPPRGEVESLKRLPRHETLNTFGFGYQLDSKLLYDLATVGEGCFGFIPDYSMVGTVFINWCATMLSTASMNQTLVIPCSSHNTQIGNNITIKTGLIQYGQPRDFIIKCDMKPDDCNDGPIDSTVLFHHSLLTAIEDCIRQNGSNQHIFKDLYHQYLTSAPNNLTIQEILKDIKPEGLGDHDEGQVHMSCSYWEKWGKHYIRSYFLAQQLQYCMNFKDPGLQIYGGDLFHFLQDEGDTIFCRIPPLEPTGYNSGYTAPTASYNTYTNYGVDDDDEEDEGGDNSGGNLGVAVSRRTRTTSNFDVTDFGSYFHNRSGGCYAGYCEILMANLTRKPIQHLKPNDQVWTPYGAASVEYVVTLGTQSMKYLAMCTIGKLVITPWHPIYIGDSWTFPSTVTYAEDRPISTVYNVILSQHHIIDVEGIKTVTLGHGYTDNPVLNHPFFSNKEKILESLQYQPGYKEGEPVYKNLQVIRDNTTHMIIGWKDQV